jgi:Na+-translocating ferredoxin:NAD+ oxidoreductase RnfD subunit
MELGAIAVSADSLTMEEPPMPAATHGFASRAVALLPHDPRILQIAFLGVLLAAGAYLRDFSLRPAQIALTFAAALSIQRLLDRLTRKPAPSLLSATITSLSLTLLLRADNLWALPVAAVFAIASKFMLRVRGKHLFNPANFGVGAALLILPGTWISPGQWGNDVALAGWMVVLGATVASRARRADISWMFLVFYLGVLAARVAWLGQRWAVWTHQLSSGALLLFAFFMISDPMTTPSHIKGRAAHAALVAAIAYTWGFGLFRTNAVLWALFVAAPMVVVWDWLWPTPKFDWHPYKKASTGKEASMVSRISVSRTSVSGTSASSTSANRPRRRRAKRALSLMLALGALTAAILASWPAAEARAFCGFYVGRADARLYNHASKVVMVRDGNRTVLSLMNDYQGEPEEFALVIPVPVVLQQGQIHIGSRELFQRIDSYSAPRLVEYYDPSPCPLPMSEMGSGLGMQAAAPLSAFAEREQTQAKALGVTVEAQYTVGEYDIVILSATQSDGLETWLGQTGYHIPQGLGAALAPYIRQGMKFFVARVNLKEHQRTGLSYLRPIQFAFESPKFMLPIRLGMINAKGSQDLIVYMLSREGRVETTDYRTVKMPSGMDVPEFVQDEFGKVYQAMFDRQVKRDEMRTVFTEYVWNMGWCDPCAAPPLSREELRALGVFWLDDNSQAGSQGGTQSGALRMNPPIFPMPSSGPVQVILTRLHVRYSAATFPEDLTFQQTQDQENFQARYVIRHPWTGSPDACTAAPNYFAELRHRHETDAATLADLTGWDLAGVLKQVGLSPDDRPEPWWRQLWSVGKN